MSLRLLMSLALSFALVGIPSEGRAAECLWQEITSLQDGVVHVELVQVCAGSSATQAGTNEPDPIRDADLDAICVATASENGVDPFEYCDIPPEDAEDYVTPGLVATAFQQIPLPASELRVQPANGRTLVNFETNFFTDAGPFDRTVTLLGQQVDLHIVPSEFGWQFGDGAALVTADGGAPYPDLRITHDYQRKGQVQPAVDTTYSATYRVNNGPWAPVPGTVTIPGVPVGLEVLTATPVLVGS